MRLNDKVAIITGTSKGIGRVMAKVLAKEGAKVILVAREKEAIDKLKNEIENEGGTALSITTDMREKNQVKNMIDKAYETFGKIDILVNNAGIPMYGFAIDSRAEEAENRYDAIMETNVRGYWYAARFVIPYMKKNNSGAIINISSVRGRAGVSNETAYCSAKGAVNMFTKSLAVEMAPFNIRVNTISPGAIQVDTIGHWIVSRYGKDAQKTYEEKFKDVHLMGMKLNQPLRILGRSEDVAYAVVYIGSDEARFVTGADLVIDGGLTAQLTEPSALDLESICEYYQKTKEMKKWLDTLE